MVNLSIFKMVINNRKRKFVNRDGVTDKTKTRADIKEGIRIQFSEIPHLRLLGFPQTGETSG